MLRRRSNSAGSERGLDIVNNRTLFPKMEMNKVIMIRNVNVGFFSGFPALAVSPFTRCFNSEAISKVRKILSLSYWEVSLFYSFSRFSFVFFQNTAQARRPVYISRGTDVCSVLAFVRVNHKGGALGEGRV